MARFSQRVGKRPLTVPIQRDEASPELRNQIWSAVYRNFFARWSDGYDYPGVLETNRDIENLCEHLWLRFFKLPADEMPLVFASRGLSHYSHCRQVVLEGEWFDMYDFVEELVQNLPSNRRRTLQAEINQALESEFAAYRFVGTELANITDEVEIAEIEAASDSPYEEARHHIAAATAHLFDRLNPDFRNATKEAISGVEAAARSYLGLHNKTLGDCLSEFRRRNLLPELVTAPMTKLYGVASDKGGVRHAIKEGDDILNFHDAKYAILVCSSFINRLTALSADTDPPRT